jgi:uncharacterized protein (DUF924 family)
MTAENPLAPEDQERIDRLLDFWFAPGMEATWYRGGLEFDAELGERFSADCQRAWGGRCDTWKETARGALALILLLDQLPRNLHRGKSEAFAQDEKARALARYMLEEGFDQELPQRMRVFCYLPLEHSEDMTDQEDCLALMSKLDQMDGVEDYSRQHRDIIARFGRFPHRNAALDRRSTAEEEAFLKEPGSSF